MLNKFIPLIDSKTGIHDQIVFRLKAKTRFKSESSNKTLDFKLSFGFKPGFNLCMHTSLRV